MSISVVRALAVAASIGLVCSSRCFAVAAGSADDWRYYNGDLAQTHYSRLRQINTHNVGHLRVAWTYDTQESAADIVPYDWGAMEVNPLVVHGRDPELPLRGLLRDVPWI